MSYCTRQEVRDMIKDGAVGTLIGDEYLDADEREAKIGPIIDEAIEDADGEIDGYLARRYSVPLSPAPKVINKFAKDIAIYNIFARIGIDEDSEAKTYLTRYNAAVKFLTFVADGKVSIGAAGPGDASAAAAIVTGFSVCSSPRLFRRSDLGGM